LGRRIGAVLKQNPNCLEVATGMGRVSFRGWGLGVLKQNQNCLEVATDMKRFGFRV
jgi:hypothetical protein